MLTPLLTGLGIGLAAGVSPGPLLVLVVTSSLRGGLRSGAAVAMAPLLSDVVVVAVVLAALDRMPVGALGWLGVVGGVVVAAVGLQTIREARTATLSAPARTPGPSSRALARGVVVNLVSPHPWISWVTVLGPLTLTAWRSAPVGGAALVAGFYATLVGSKLVLAALVSRGRHRLSDATYRRSVTVAGVVLLVLAGVMVAEFAGQIR